MDLVEAIGNDANIPRRPAACKMLVLQRESTSRIPMLSQVFHARLLRVMHERAETDRDVYYLWDTILPALSGPLKFG